MENDCSIEFYFQTTQGGYAGKNTFCMGVSAKIKNPYLCSLVLEPLNKKTLVVTSLFALIIILIGLSSI